MAPRAQAAPGGSGAASRSADSRKSLAVFTCGNGSSGTGVPSALQSGSQPSPGCHSTIGYTAGKMRRYRIRILPGDRVKVELSPYDLNRGRIVYRIR